MTQSQARAFLEKLASDDDFRAQVERDPVGTLAAHGITVKPEDLPKAGRVRLPSKEAIRANLDALAGELESTAGEIFFAL
jgi:putative modified peptide